MYRFKTVSDDGSRLYIGSELVVDNDGFHSVRSISEQVALKAGYHEISVLYFEGNVDEKLKVEVAGPDSEMNPIGIESLFRKSR